MNNLKRGLKRSTRILQCFVVLLGLMTMFDCHAELTGMLNPKGVITHEERILFFDAIALMLIVVLPVIIMSFAFAYKYRASRQSEYKPNWSHSHFLELLWWGIPIIIVTILGVMTWKLTHKLDPYRKINDEPPALQVQVIALPWKWLFIYPEYHIATINELVIPKNKQIEFWLTGDASAMAGFFVPQLGSQIYTMAGMKTELHLIASEEGVYRGVNSQFNGDGFSDMHFPVRVVDDQAMETFIHQARTSKHTLSDETYQLLRQPSEKSPITYYRAVKSHLFEDVIAYYTGSHAQQPTLKHNINP